MNNVVLNVAIGERFIKWQSRLVSSLIEKGENNILLYRNSYPKSCPSHDVVPYAFKPFLFAEARDKGYDQALWLDSPIRAIKPINQIWDYLSKVGYEFHFSWWKLGQWCSDAALKKHCISRSEAMEINDNWACILGLNFRNTDANLFLDQWLKAAQDDISFIGDWKNDNKQVSNDERCMGHRHDQSISSILCYQMGLKRIPWEPPLFFAYDFQNINNTVCLLHNK